MGVWILICLFCLTNSLHLSTFIDEKVLEKVFFPFVVKLYCGMTYVYDGVSYIGEGKKERKED